MKLVRRLYDWVLGWADTPYGLPALTVLAFVESSVFPVPPDVLLIALSLSAPLRAYRYALFTTLGSVAGGALGYLIGALFWTSCGAFFYAYVPGFTEAKFQNVQQLFIAYGFWAVFLAGFTPIPYKIFTIASGVFLIPLPVFFGASMISRGLRFFLVAGLIRYFGPGIKSFIDRYFNILSILFALLLVGGFVLVAHYL